MDSCYTEYHTVKDHIQPDITTCNSEEPQVCWLFSALRPFETVFQSTSGVSQREGERKEKLDFFSERSFFISLMNTKSGIFTRGFATRENTAFIVYSVK